MREVIFYFYSQLKSRIYKQTYTKNESEGANKEKSQSFLYCFHKNIAFIAFPTDLKFDMDCRFAQLTFDLSIIRAFFLDLLHCLNFKPLPHASLMHIPHRSLTLARRNQFILSLFNFIEANPTLLMMMQSWQRLYAVFCLVGVSEFKRRVDICGVIHAILNQQIRLLSVIIHLVRQSKQVSVRVPVDLKLKVQLEVLSLQNLP